ncbi:hypothetical protein U1E44_13755 [Arenibacter sp. GZD96]|uniref:hypothetical protein n=1 Tax=Aurantibrevibacter litoralis TaxID=3106030 RepID=UPI002AFFD571|nr:hypothetical protein [Arenibacter sp. GZD-96]MEA1787161.1 hypothetical protein [Arenibacter sp. GZD-96]
MKLEKKEFNTDKDTLFEAARRCLVIMKTDIKLSREDAGIMVGLVESLTSYPSGELMIIEITSAESNTAVLKVSSESMAINSRLFKKTKDSRNVSKFLHLMERYT